MQQPPVDQAVGHGWQGHSGYLVGRALDRPGGQAKGARRLNQAEGGGPLAVRAGELAQPGNGQDLAYARRDKSQATRSTIAHIALLEASHRLVCRLIDLRGGGA